MKNTLMTMRSQFKEVFQGNGLAMDKLTFEDIVMNENVYNGLIVATVRDKVIVEVSVNKNIYKRKKNR